MLRSRLLERNRIVQERWYRMKIQQLFGAKIKTAVLWVVHKKINWQYAKIEKVIDDAIKAAEYYLRTTNGEMFPESKQFFNIGLYFFLAERDVQALKADAFAHPNQAKRNIALRTLLLTLYEWDMGKVTGRKMRKIYQVNGLTEQAKTDLVNSLRELNKVRRRIQGSLSETRHNAIAHRDPDAMNQYKIIQTLEALDFKEELRDFYSVMDSLIKAMIVSVKQVGSIPGLLSQVSWERETDFEAKHKL